MDNKTNGNTFRKPHWLVAPRKNADERKAVEGILKSLNLNTVCREANCPNCGDCFARRTATFMILGTNCTRNCRFCNVTSSAPVCVDSDEPENVSSAAAQLGLKYVVITSVTRDDLADGGAAHFAATVRAIKKRLPNAAVEVLIPDFLGDLQALKLVCDCGAEVVGHNMETIARLYSEVRPQAVYERSLMILENIKRLNPAARSKTGIMLGLGETKPEVVQLLKDIRQTGCEFLTIGQYLAPSVQHYPVREYIHPDMFDEYAEIAKELGFVYVASAPLVRSSFHAEEALLK